MCVILGAFQGIARRAQYLDASNSVLLLQDMKILRKYDLDVKDYEEQKAQAQKDNKHFEGRPPLQKLRQRDKDLVAEREIVEKGGARVIVVHCTHGFNRSGFMLCHLMKRLGPTSWSVAECVKQYVAILAHS
jgi:protein tyrosine/serine phosphatase